MINVPADVAGKPVLLNMWATWCPPCRHEMESLEEIYRAFAGRLLANRQGEFHRAHDGVRALVRYRLANAG